MTPQGRAAPPILFPLPSNKIGSSARRLRRSPGRTLTRPDPAWPRAPSFTDVEEMTMTLEQHIEELRAELRTCISRKERRQIERDLEAARDELARRPAAELR